MATPPPAQVPLVGGRSRDPLSGPGEGPPPIPQIPPRDGSQGTLTPPPGVGEGSRKRASKLSSNPLSRRGRISRMRCSRQTTSDRISSTRGRARFAGTSVMKPTQCAESAGVKTGTTTIRGDVEGASRSSGASPRTAGCPVLPHCTPALSFPGTRGPPRGTPGDLRGRWAGSGYGSTAGRS